MWGVNMCSLGEEDISCVIILLPAMMHSGLVCLFQVNLAAFGKILM